ncbi:hypothetical protein GJAV_G00165660 [Gymnothorax javanicus]|nr:hypothetical protein GJAV_G00165660 [Gymnothorax javanicus]
MPSDEGHPLVWLRAISSASTITCEIINLEGIEPDRFYQRDATTDSVLRHGQRFVHLKYRTALPLLNRCFAVCRSSGYQLFSDSFP